MPYANPEKVKAANDRYRAMHSEKVKERTAAWRETHRDHLRDYARERYARLKRLTPAQPEGPRDE